jgi:coenzyme F420-reducing hydrogenase alpha subunit
VELKQYFRKMRELENTIPEAYPLVVSLETPDGGKPGMITEVSRLNAAKMIIEGRALLASESEKQAYREQQAAARAAAEKAELAKRVQVAILSDPDLRGSLHVKRNSDSSNSGK